MPSPNELVDNICYQMMRGSKQTPFSAAERAVFKAKYQKLVESIMPHLPRASSAVGAVVCICALYYGREKAVKFADNLKNGVFDGLDDPVFLLWRFLNTRKNKTTDQTYRLTVGAAKAYCEGKKLNRLRELKSDIFKWGNGWEAKKADLASQHS